MYSAAQRQLNKCMRATRVYARFYRRRPLTNRPRTERIRGGPVQMTAFIHLAMMTAHPFVVFGEGSLLECL